MNLTTGIKIENFLKENVLNGLEGWLEILLEGDLQNYERALSKSLIEVQEFISASLVLDSSKALFEQLKTSGKEAGGTKIKARSMTVRMSTGQVLKVVSPYVKRSKKAWKGSRHLLANYWGVIKGASPLLYDKVAYLSVLCPSYELAHQTLLKFGTTLCLSSVRAISNRLATHCFDYGEQDLMLAEKESLQGKRVVISIDGGRTRTRVYTGEFNENGQAKYETNWKEPKLFVIDVLDEHGQASRYELPIYGCRFDEKAILALVKSYLLKLEINKATEVQLLADGAPWIWKNLKPLLESLGVEAARITETLDYFHASEYIHDLVEHMPSQIGKKKKKAYLAQFKNWLWNGKSREIIRICRKIYKRPSQIINRWIQYLDKHQERTQYATYQANNLMCGSGIIESGIRRIINLRFKNASTFWKKEIVEKLYFFRAALLSKRWDIVMKNIANAD